MYQGATIILSINCRIDENVAYISVRLYKAVTIVAFGLKASYNRDDTASYVRIAFDHDT